jgi:hypothetical protein
MDPVSEMLCFQVFTFRMMDKVYKPSNSEDINCLRVKRYKVMISLMTASFMVQNLSWKLYIIQIVTKLSATLRLI